MRTERPCNSPNNQGVLLLAALASIQLARGLDGNQLQTLSAFFTVLGDNLALLAAPPCRKCGITEQETGAE